jgi:elongation factor G
VKIRLEPLPPGGKFIFEKQIPSGVIPREFIPSIEKGVKEAMENGILAGYPMVNIKVILYDGSFHEVDSSELAFKIAASMAFQDGARRALPKLLEPMMEVEVVVPEEYMGDVIGDLNARRGNISGIHPRKDAQVISVMVPLSEMFGYATKLRSITQGRAVFSMEFSRYEEVPENLSEKILSRVRGY